MRTMTGITRQSDEQICSAINADNSNSFLIAEAADRAQIVFDNRTAKFVVRQQSVCGCPLDCLDWNTHEQVSGAAWLDGRA